MRKSFKFATAALLAAAAIGLVACSSSKKDNKTADSKGGDYRVEVIAKGFQHDFWKAVNKGAEQAADEFGAKITFFGPQNETAIAEQLEQLNNAINKNPDAIALAALDTESELDAIKQAQAKNIPLIGFDSGALQQDAIRNGLFVGSVTQDPIQIGYQSVKLAIEAAQGKEVKDVDTGSKWYDAKNIDSDEIKPLLYQ